MDVAFDTTALSNLAGAELADRASAVLPTSARLVVPHTSLLEILDGSDEERAIGRLEILRRLRLRLGRRLIVSADLETFLSREHRGPGLYRSLAVGQDNVGKAIRFLLSQAPIDMDGVRRIRPKLAQALAKKLAKDKDDEARKNRRTLVADADALELRQRILNRFSEIAISNDNPVFEAIVRRYGDRSKAIQRAPLRFRSTVIYSAYTYRTIVGAIFADVHGPPTDLRAPRWGSWTDAKVAACAAYARVFVSDDRDQRARLAYVSGVFGFGISTVTLEQWFAHHERGTT